MADWQLIEEGLKRGYSLDEVTDIIAKEEGVDPSYARERGFDSPAILRRLGYVKPEAPKPTRNAFAYANDTAIDVANSATGLLKAGVDLVAPDSSVSESMSGFIKRGEESQSDWKKQSRADLQQKLSEANGEFDKAGIYAKHAVVNDPLGTAAQIAGNAAPFAIAGRAMQGLQAASKVIASVGLSSGLTAGEVRGNIYEKIKNTPDSVLSESSKEYMELRKRMSEDEAKSVVGSSIINNIPELAAAAIVGGLGGKYGFEGMMTGVAPKFGGRIVNGLIGVADEATQGAVEQLASNVGVRRVLPNQSLTEDVGLNAAAEGIMGVGAVAAPVRPSVAPSPSITSAPTTDDAIKAFESEVESAAPAPRGSFSGMDDLAGLIESERSDLGKRRGLLAQQQQDARDMVAEFSGLVKDEQIDQSYRLNDAQQQRDAERTREGGYDLALQQREEQQGHTVDQLTAASEAQGFGAEEPTAMQLAMQQAQQKALDNEFSGLLKQERASLNEMRANVKRVAGVPVEQISTPQLEEIAQSESHPNTKMAAVAALNDRHDAIQQERERLMQLRETRLEKQSNQPEQGAQHGAESHGTDGQVATPSVAGGGANVSGGGLDAAMVAANGGMRGTASAGAAVSSGGQVGAVPVADQPANVRALTENAAKRQATQLTNQGYPTVAYPHPTQAGMWAIGSNEEAEGALNKGEQESEEEVPAVEVRAPVQRKRPASNNIAQAIINMGGISTSLKNDVLGDAATRTRPGLFTSNGTTDLGALASRLSGEFGFSQINLNDATDNSGAKQLADLIARAVNGESILNEEGMILAQEAEEVARHQDDINRKAEELGIKPSGRGRPFSKVEAEVLKLMEIRLNKEIEEAGINLEEARAIALRDISEEKLAEIQDKAMDALGENPSILEIYRALTAGIKEAVNENERNKEAVAEGSRSGSEVAGAGHVEEASRPATSGTAREGQSAEAEVAPEFGLVGQTEEEAIAEEQARRDAEAKRQREEQDAENKRQADADRGDLTPEDVAEAHPAIAENSERVNTEDAGEELSYNRRNRSGSLKWSDIKDQEAALRVKEVTKAKVYQKPDYAALAEEIGPVKAHLVKQVYDHIAATPQTGRDVPTDAQLEAYIDAVNSIMDATIAWAKDAVFESQWRMTANGKTLVDTLYPEGWRPQRDVVVLLGGNRHFGGVQPGYKEIKRAEREIAKGWPGKREAWQTQGYKVVETAETAKLQEGRSSGNKVYYIEVGGRYFDSAPSKADGEKMIAEMQPWLLLNKQGRIVSQHQSEEQAVEAARNATKRGGSGGISDKGIAVENAERVGPARRMEGENVTSDQLKETFGFRGVNFGTWMKGKANDGERQLHLNHAYDAFLDLAEIIGVPPKAMSLNGMLGLAIGAQGNGKYAAHFVPGVNEINLTRTSGAGSLAHEFGHALDHYFARLGGLDRQAEPFLTEHTGKPAQGELRPEILDKFKAIIKAMNERPMTQEEYEAEHLRNVEKLKTNVDSWTKAIRRDFESAAIQKVTIEDGKAKREKAISKLDALIERIRDKDLGDGRIAIGRYESASPVVMEIRELYKETFGRQMPKNNILGLQSNIDSLVYATSKRDADNSHTPQVSTDYAKNALSLDKDKGGKPYWSTNLEKFARAFDAFVTDTLDAKAAKNSYLSHAGREGATVPAGEERKAINEAFKALVDAIETKETDSGVAMFNAKSGSIGNPIDAAALESTIASVIAASPSQWRRDTVVTATLFSELPAPIVEKAKAEGYDAHGRNRDGQKLTGATYDGKVYLVQENISSEIEAEETLLHERIHQILHGNAEDENGKALRQSLGRLYSRIGGKDAIVALAKRIGADMSGPLAALPKVAVRNRPAFLVDEFLAHVEGQRAYEKFPQSVVRAIREFYGEFRDWLRSSKFVKIADAVGVNLGTFTQSDLSWTLKKIRQQQAGTGSKAIRFMTAWHGSPHDHDGFDSSKIGTGEGAQAYGYGHYFASRKQVAEYYRDQLSKVTPAHNTIDGKRITKKLLEELQQSDDVGVRVFFNSKDGMRSAGITNIAQAVDSAIESAQEVRDDYQQRLDKHEANPPFASTYGPVDYRTWIAAQDRLIAGLQKLKERIGFVPAKKNGRLYQVELAPAEDEYLDYDRPLSDLTGSSKAAIFQGSPDGISRNAESLGDLIKRESFRSQGFSGLDAPTQSFVFEQVSRAVKDNEVLNSVVRLIPVDVMNILFEGNELSAKKILHNSDMLKDLLSSSTDKPVSSGVNGAVSSLVRIVADHIAKRPVGVFGREGSDNFASAMGAGVGESLHKRIIQEIGISATGGDFYKAISRKLGSDKAASEYLHSIGIRGIKYLDGSSRPSIWKYDVDVFGSSGSLLKQHRVRTKAEADDIVADAEASGRTAKVKQIQQPDDQNHNYVIFDDADVKITAKESRRASNDLDFTQPQGSEPLRKTSFGYANDTHNLFHVSTFKGNDGDVSTFDVHDTNTGRKLGEVALGLRGDEITTLANIEAKDKKSGFGEQLLRSLVANNPDGIYIINMLPEAVPFWQKMGVSLDEHFEGVWEHGNGVLTEEAIQTARNSERGIAAEDSGGERKESRGSEESGRGRQADNPVSSKGVADKTAPANAGVSVSAPSEPVRRIQAVVERFKSQFKGTSALDIRVVSTTFDIPARFRPSPFAEGVFHDDAGLVYLVTMNLRNPRGVLSENRAWQVLLHESVGHYGLSQMMGDKFAGILKAVKQATLAGRKVSETQSNPLQPGDKDYTTWEAVKLRYPKASDAEVAQEVLARMSETDPGSSIVGYAVATVRQWVRDVARAMGVNVVVSTSELRDLVAKASGYMRRGDNLAEEHEPSGLVAASTGVAREGGKRGLESRRATDDIALEYGIMPHEATPSAVKPQGPIWSAPEMSRTDNIIYTMQDKNIDLKRVQQAIKATVGGIRDDIDAYLQEELFHGRAAKITEEFLDKEVNPLISLMRASNVSMEEMETFLWARHAKERNAQIAKINDEMPDGGSGLTNKQADDLMAGKDVKIGDKTIAGVKPARKKLLSDLAGRVDAITKGNRALLERYGLESADTLNAWDGAYKHYVPLHREDAESHLAGMGTGQGYSVKGSSSKRATGSSRPVENILANLALQRERIITRGEKNRVAQSLYGLAKEMPNADLWEVDVKPTMRTTAMIGGREQVVDAVDPNFRNKPNVVFARFNGEDRFVVFNEHNERAVRMAEALKNLDADDISHLLGEVSRWTRYFASINTQYNPIFGVTNLVRDVQTGLLNLKSTPIAGKQKEMMGHLVQALPAVFKALRADRKGQAANGSWAQLWEEFQEVGGQTGYRDMFRNSHERAEALQNALDPTWWQKTWWGKAATVGGVLAVPEQAFLDKVGKPLMELLSDYNTMMENGIRLAAYKVALDTGMTQARAASLAKNLTVNFNRKGQAARQVGAMYAFFNASIQGTARMAETLNHGAKPGELLGKAGKQIVYGGLLLGAVQAMLLMAAGFDDEEPPEFVRDRNIIIPTGNGKYVSIPMPLGFHVLPAISRISIEFTAGGFKKPGEHLVHIIDVLLDSFNPIGNAGLSMQTVAPTVLDPIAALTENKDWSGRQIARQDFSKLNPTPGYTRAKDTASSLSRGLAYALNYLSGGGEYGIGIVSPTPDQIDYLLGQLTGGVGRELGKVVTTAEALTTGEDLPPHKIPLVGRFYGDTTGQSSEASKFYGTLENLSEHRGTLDRMKDAHDVEAYREYAKEHPEIRFYDRANKVQRELASLRKLKRKMIERNAERAKVRQIEDRMKTLMARFNKSVSEQEGNHR